MSHTAEPAKRRESLEVYVNFSSSNFPHLPSNYLNRSRDIILYQELNCLTSQYKVSNIVAEDPFTCFPSHLSFWRSSSSQSSTSVGLIALFLLILRLQPSSMSSRYLPVHLLHCFHHSRLLASGVEAEFGWFKPSPITSSLLDSFEVSRGDKVWSNCIEFLS